MADNVRVTSGGVTKVAQLVTLPDAGGGTVTISGPLGRSADAASVSAALSTEDVALVGPLTETAPVSDTASSGLNGRLQRIAQRLTSLIAVFSSDANGTVVQPALTANQWTYVANISNSTTAVTFKAAAGAGVRNYLSAIQLAWVGNTNTTEIVIRDGSAGTTLWRGGVSGAAGTIVVPLPIPLRGTANTLMEVIGTVAGGAGSSISINVQGFTSTL